MLRRTQTQFSLAHCTCCSRPFCHPQGHLSTSTRPRATLRLCERGLVLSDTPPDTVAKKTPCAPSPKPDICSRCSLVPESPHLVCSTATARTVDVAIRLCPPSLLPPPPAAPVLRLAGEDTTPPSKPSGRLVCIHPPSSQPSIGSPASPARPCLPPSRPRCSPS